MGYRTVAVHSDSDAVHVRVADEAVRIGPADVGQSYLCADRLLEAAAKTDAVALDRPMANTDASEPVAAARYPPSVSEADINVDEALCEVPLAWVRSGDKGAHRQHRPARPRGALSALAAPPSHRRGGEATGSRTWSKARCAAMRCQA